MIDQETLHLFDELYYATYSDILKYVILNCSTLEDVQDIIQNIYLEVLRKLQKNKTLIGKSYIIGIVKNKVKDYYRFRYKNKIVSLFSSIKGQEEIALMDTINSGLNIEKTILEKEDIEEELEYE